MSEPRVEYADFLTDPARYYADRTKSVIVYNSNAAYMPGERDFAEWYAAHYSIPTAQCVGIDFGTNLRAPNWTFAEMQANALDPIGDALDLYEAQFLLTTPAVPYEYETLVKLPGVTYSFIPTKPIENTLALARALKVAKESGAYPDGLADAGLDNGDRVNASRPPSSLGSVEAWRLRNQYVQQAEFVNYLNPDAHTKLEQRYRTLDPQSNSWIRPVLDIAALGLSPESREDWSPERWTWAGVWYDRLLHNQSYYHYPPNDSDRTLVPHFGRIGWPPRANGIGAGDEGFNYYAEIQAAITAGGAVESAGYTYANFSTAGKNAVVSYELTSGSATDPRDFTFATAAGLLLAAAGATVYRGKQGGGAVSDAVARSYMGVAQDYLRMDQIDIRYDPDADAVTYGNSLEGNVDPVPFMFWHGPLGRNDPGTSSDAQANWRTEFEPDAGAVMSFATSFGCQHIPSFMKRGALGFFASAYEPLAQGLGDPQDYVNYVLRGYTLAEVFTYRERLGQYNYALYGDPLFRPFAQLPNPEWSIDHARAWAESGEEDDSETDLTLAPSMRTQIVDEFEEILTLGEMSIEATVEGAVVRGIFTRSSIETALDNGLAYGVQASLMLPSSRVPGGVIDRTAKVVIEGTAYSVAGIEANPITGVTRVDLVK